MAEASTQTRVKGSIRSVLIALFGPPVVLLLWAHLIPPHWDDSTWPALILAGLAGLAGIVTAPWRVEIKTLLATAYVALAFFGMRFLALLAVCTTGDCL